MKKITLFAAIAMIASTSFAQIGAVRIRQQAAIGQQSQKERIVAIKPNTVLGAGETKSDLKAVNVPICFKYSVTAAQIAGLGAATSGNILLTTLPAKSVVMVTTVKQSASVTGGAASGILTSDNTNVTAADTVTIGSKVYTFVGTVKATGTLTSDATAPSDGDTVTIGNKIYTFKTALTPTEGEVLIGASAAIALDNLKAAINHTGTPDTDYKVAVANPQVTATTNTDTTQVIEAITAGSSGNSIVTTEAGTHTSFGAATLTGGSAPETEGNVNIGANADATLLNLIRAINHSGTPNTDYKAAAANTQVTAATSVTSHAFKVTAITPGSGGNSIATTETSSHLTWGGSVLAGGGTAVTAATARVITANNNYGTAFDVFQAPGDTVLDFYATPKSENFAATTAVNLAMTSTGDNLGTIGAGAIDVWITYYVRP
jgi:hypothetical protein